jgi:hypothetical protein
MLMVGHGMESADPGDLRLRYLNSLNSIDYYNLLHTITITRIIARIPSHVSK